MAGLHQLWRLDMQRDRCGVYSGCMFEGNFNSSNTKTRWAQPSGLALGELTNPGTTKKPVIFVADSESSSIRALDLTNRNAVPVAGANENDGDLYAFGDVDGQGYDAKLQHPLGVHYCVANETLYVCDTYNHKVKILAPLEGQGS